MKKFLFMPDSFKGTLSSAEICDILEESAQKFFPGVSCCKIPVADGGEGSVDCFVQALNGSKITCTVANPFFEPIDATFGLIHDGQTAVIEMAACAGLPLVEQRRNPLTATTYGVGELMVAALDRQVSTIIIGLGGSATNDGGCGAAAALGVRFINAAGESFIPTGGTLDEICTIDCTQLDPRLAHTTVIAMCDIDNPMTGPNGASFIFGPQKGADPVMVEALDAKMKHLARLMRTQLKCDLENTPGSGAAGAMGAGCEAFFHAKLKSGIDTVLDTTHFEDLAADADFIFTGEGRLDSQSLQGKVVIGISRRAQALNVPVIAIVGGAIDKGLEPGYAMGLSAVFSINRLPEDFSVSRYKSKENLTATAENIFRLIKCSTTL